jgi:protein tyrosine phosphatase
MLVQIQYHGWPDHSVPDSPETLLRVQLLCRSLASNDPSPILVHCTAGCGRTGTFCAINMSIQALDQTPSIDPVAKAFQQLRLDRMEMVQTQRQLAFCYEACAWWFLSPLQ